MAAISLAFLASLRCPFCASDIQPERAVGEGSDGLEHGIVRCGCYRYPVVDGILVLRRDPLHSTGRFGRAVACLERDDVRSARRSLLEPEPAFARKPTLRRLARDLARDWLPGARRDRVAEVLEAEVGSFAEEVERLKVDSFAEYLVKRFANPSFLSAIPPLMQLGERVTAATDPLGRERWILDAACGVGHLSFLAARLFPDLRSVATDLDFENLALARRHFLSPEAIALCVDGNFVLPFARGSFDLVVCLDALHYVDAKVTFLRELGRCLRPDGSCVLAHVHNALQHNPSPGTPLTAEGYARCLAGLEPTVFPELDLLRQWFETGTVDLSRDATPQALAEAPAFTILAGRDPSWRSAPGPLADRFARRAGRVRWNPIYTAEPRGDRVHLSARWRNPGLAAECAAVERFLPRSLEVERDTWERFRVPSEDHSSEPASSWVRSFVLVPEP